MLRRAISYICVEIENPLRLKAGGTMDRTAFRQYQRKNKSDLYQSHITYSFVSFCDYNHRNNHQGELTVLLLCYLNITITYYYPSFQFLVLCASQVLTFLVDGRKV